MPGLRGMNEICDYCRRSESTIMIWIQSRGFPAVKMKPGGWESDSDMIDEWRKEQIFKRVNGGGNGNKNHIVKS
jgi:hypothetical protein